MTVNVGTMQLPVPEDPDAVRTYLNGTHVSGGLWTALTRSSNHDHSGGTSGIQLTATSIPDGSITTAKLDPAVLGPYALVDGSKPFTGTVTMSADTLVRDTLRFGAKPAGVADTTLARTGAGALRVDSHLGVGVNPAAWSSSYRALQVGAQGSLFSNATTANTTLADNNYLDASTANRAIQAGAASILVQANGQLSFHNAPSVAAGAAQTFATRMALAPTGTLSLIPDPAVPAMIVGNMSTPLPWYSTFRAIQVGASGAFVADSADYTAIFHNSYTDAAGTALAHRTPNAPGYRLTFQAAGMTVATAPAVAAGNPQALSNRMALAPTGTLTLTPDAGQAHLSSGSDSYFKVAVPGPRVLTLNSPGSAFHPEPDNTISSGHPSFRYSVVYAVAGAINTSSREAKEGITPLDPLACYQAAKDVRWYEFAYLPPAYTEPEPPPDIAYDAADDNETKAEKKARRDEAEAASKAAHLKMVAETAPARNQRGFVFPVGAESKDEAGGTLPPVPDLFGLSDRESTTPQADLATLGCALQEVIRRLETLEGAAA